MFARVCLVAAAGLLLASCFPASYVVNMPQAPSGERMAMRGYGSAEDTIQFSFPDDPDIKLYLRVRGTEGKYAFLSIGMEIDPKTEQIWAWDRQKTKEEKMRPYFEAKAQGHAVTFSSNQLAVVAEDGSRASYTLEFPGGAPTGFPLTGDGYSFYFPILRPQGTFTVEVPEIHIDGKTFNIPPVRFTPTRISTVEGIN